MGAFGTSRLNPNKPEDARLFGLPMRPGKNLQEKKRYVQEQIVRLRIFTTQPYGWRKAGGWRTLTRRGF